MLETNVRPLIQVGHQKGGFMDTMVNHLKTTEWSSHGHDLENGESSGTIFFNE